MPQLETSTYLSQFFWLITSFLCLWFFMAWVIVPKIEEVLEQRRRKIDDYVQKAEQINKQALISLNKYEKALEKAKKEAEQTFEQNKSALEKTVADRHAEIEQLLERKIADTEFMLAKERQETVAAIDDVSVSLANLILEKLDVKNVDENLLKNCDGGNN